MSRSIDKIQDLASFRALKEEWNSLASRFNTPLLRHEWFTACAESFYPPGELSIRVVRENGRIVAIAPLVAIPTYGIRRLEMLGVGILREPSGFLYEDEDSLRFLIDHLMAERVPMYLGGLISDSTDISVLKNTKRQLGVLSHSVQEASPWIPIDRSREEFEASISSRWRSAFRRAQRRAEESGRVEFEFVSPTPETLGSYLPEILQVESAGWKSRTGTAMKTYAPLYSFFRAYTESAARLGMLRLGIMRIDRKAVAVQLLVDCANRLWILKVGYDEQYARCSPGMLLMNWIIGHAFEEGYSGFEFLGRSEQWLEVWNPENHYQETIRCYPISPLTVVSHGIELSTSVYGRIRTRMTRSGPKAAIATVAKKITAKVMHPTIHTAR